MILGKGDQQPRSVRAQRYGLVIGGVALAAMAALGVAANGAANDNDLLAGSGDGAPNTTYVQPSVSGMTVGATASVSAAAPTLATPFARPAI